MLNQVHISKGIGESFISNLGIALFHTLQSLSHRNLTRRCDFQAVIINRNLNISMIQIATMHGGIDNQFSDCIRRDFVNILTINTFKGCSHVDVSQNKLVCLLNLFPNRTIILASIYKNFLGCSLKHATLHSHIERTTAG